MAAILTTATSSVLESTWILAQSLFFSSSAPSSSASFTGTRASAGVWIALATSFLAIIASFLFLARWRSKSSRSLLSSEALEGTPIPVVNIKVSPQWWIPNAVYFSRHPRKFLDICAQTYGEAFQFSVGPMKYVFLEGKKLRDLVSLSDEIANNREFMRKYIQSHMVPEHFHPNAADNPFWDRIAVRAITMGVQRRAQLEHWEKIVAEETEKYFQRQLLGKHVAGNKKSASAPTRSASVAAPSSSSSSDKENSSSSSVAFNPFTEGSELVLRCVFRFIFGDIFETEDELSYGAHLAREFEYHVCSKTMILFPWLPFGIPKRCKELRKELYTFILKKLETVEARIQSKVEADRAQRVTMAEKLAATGQKKKLPQAPIREEELPLSQAEITYRFCAQYQEAGRDPELSQSPTKPSEEAAVASRVAFLIIAIIFGAHVNTTNVMGWILTHAAFAKDNALAEEIRQRVEQASQQSLKPSETTVNEEADSCETCEGGETQRSEYKSLQRIFENLANEAILHHRVSGMMLPRQVQKPAQLNGMQLIPGQSLVPSIRNPIARLREVGQDPSVFSPWRWETPEGEKILKNRDALFFGGGRHLCTGKAMAIAFLSVSVRMIFARFNVEAVAAEIGGDTPQLPEDDLSKTQGIPTGKNARIILKPL